jgi:hypothetical protein
VASSFHGSLVELVSRVTNSLTIFRAGHPGWLHCSSFKYSSILIIRALHPGAALRKMVANL